MNFILERVNSACRYVRDSNKVSITFKQLVSSTRTSFRKHDCVLSIKTKKDKTLETSEFYVNAFYDAEDDYNDEVAIEIFIYHNFSDELLFNSTQITDFLIQVYDATVHEYRHQQQSIRREYNVYSDHEQSPYKSYLKDSDELDAYSMSIAIELLRHMSKERAKKYMSKITIMAKMRRGNTLVSPNLKAYIDNFGLNRVTKKMSKKVYKHLDAIDIEHIFM